MRIGLFFGSFDPPHIGHVNVVMGAINSNQVDRVLVIPAYQNLWKENSSKFSYRYAMSCMQFDTLPFVHVSDVEKDLAGPAYPRGIPTYVVLEELKSRMPEDELVIITTPETSVNDDPKDSNRQNVTMRFMAVVDESHIGISTNAIKGQLGGEENEVKAIMWVKISDLDNYQWAFNHRHLIEGIFYTYVDYEEVEGLDDLFAE